MNIYGIVTNFVSPAWSVAVQRLPSSDPTRTQGIAPNSRYSRWRGDRTMYSWNTGSQYITGTFKMERLTLADKKALEEFFIKTEFSKFFNISCNYPVDFFGYIDSQLFDIFLEDGIKSTADLFFPEGKGNRFTLQFNYVSHYKSRTLESKLR